MSIYGMPVLTIARIAHEMNRAYCAAIGDHSQVSWDECPDWQKSSAIDGVEHLLRHPNAGPEGSHMNWMIHKQKEGWTWGPCKDPEKKQHPCMVPYLNLPPEQRIKDTIFHTIVRELQAVGLEA